MYNRQMFSKRTISNFVVIIALASIGIVIGIYTETYYQRTSTNEYMEGVFWPNPKKISEFQMVDHSSNAFSLEQLKGQWTFIFFGYTNCPDVCPTTMAVLNEVYKLINDADDPIETQIIFVTIDPDRDSIDKLAGYIGHFNSKFIALGGTHEQLDSLTSQIGISYLNESAAEDGSYLVSHTSSIFLMDPNVQLISIFSQPFNPLDIQSRFVDIEQFISNQN
jgi:protein SCO1/2